MKPHYRKVKGWNHHPGRNVYYIPMSKSEVRERRLAGAVIGTMVALVGGLIGWVVSMV